MFYPVESLKRGGRFYLCWVADSWPLRFAAITHRQLWSQDIRDLCEGLMEVMNNESGRPNFRFSLRLSSQLMRGLVRLYERKVSVFLGDLCMLNAHVFKHANKKFVVSVEAVHRPQPALPLPRPELPEEPHVRVEEMIQNSGNVVANVQDITLKEAVVPEIQVPNDNFGEENPDQALKQLLEATTVEQMLLAPEGDLQPPEKPSDVPEESLRAENAQRNENDRTATEADRTVEQMLHHDASVNRHSLDLEADKSDKSHLSANKSRLGQDRQMERISEHDLSIHRKSTAPEQMEIEFEKDIPLVPEAELPPPSAPAPEPPAPPHIVVTEPEVPVEVAPVPALEPAPQLEPVDIQLEELEQEQLTRRRRPRRLAIDKRTKLSAAYLRARIDNIHVELRCEDSSDDIADLRVPFDTLCRRPAHAGSRLVPRGSYRLLALFQRRLATEPRSALTDQESEPEPVRRRASRSVQPAPPPVPAEPPTAPAEPQEPRIEPPTVVPAEPDQTMLNVSVTVPDLNVTEIIPNLEVSEPRVSVPEKLPEPSDQVPGPQEVAEMPQDVERMPVEPEPVDISMLPTQVLQTLSQPPPQGSAKRASQQDRASKRLRPSGIMSFQESIVSQAAADKENIPPGGSGDAPPQPHDVSAMLQEAGLTDVQPLRPTGEPLGPVEPSAGRGLSDSWETPLGSLDRTKVSLGDSVRTTDTQLFMRKEWGIEGTMVKILGALRAGSRPVTVHSLVARGPAPHARRAIIAARCFTSVLKLKQHGFINVTKEPNSLEIKEITLGSRFDNIFY